MSINFRAILNFLKFPKTQVLLLASLLFLMSAELKDYISKPLESQMRSPLSFYMVDPDIIAQVLKEQRHKNCHK